MQRNTMKQIKSFFNLKDMLSIKLKDTYQTWREISSSKKPLLYVMCTSPVGHEISDCSGLMKDMTDND